MKFYEVVHFFKKLEETSSRLDMTLILSDMIKCAKHDEVDKLIYLSGGRLVPKYIALEFNIAEKLIITAISELGYLKKDIINYYKELGDLGLVASTIRSDIKSEEKELSLLDVYQRLLDLAKIEGQGSVALKINALADLMKDLDPLSTKYVIRIIQGTLRLGFGEKTVIDALSWLTSDSKKNSKKIERALAVCSDLGLVTKAIVKYGIKGLENIKLTPGIPVQSKLVQREIGAGEIFKRLGSCYIQPKFDGLRCQIHLWVENGEKRVRLFSRNLEAFTDMFPEIVEKVKKLKVKSLILDSEVIGYNPKSGKFIQFQETMKRKRKYDIDKTAKDIPVTSFVFDILYLDGEDLTLKSLKHRLELLEKILAESKNNNIITKAETILVQTKDELQKYFTEYVQAGLEGLIAKSQNSIYEAGTRNFEWIKLKGAYQENIADSVDAVILGYYKGKGKLTKFGIGAVLVGVYDKDNDKFVTIAKIGTGVKEEEWKEIKSKLDKHVIKSLPPRVDISKELLPDILVYPQIVIAVQADQITKSPLHTAGKRKGTGYALRFPRFISFRQDKGPQEATLVSEIIELYEKSKSRTG